MEFNVAVLPGDGVGPEVVAQAVKVLQAVGGKFGHKFHLHAGSVGGSAIDTSGIALSEETLKMCKQCDAVLLGAVGGPKWDNPLAKVHPEDGLLALRKGLGLFANLRPVKVFPMLINSTTLKPEVIQNVDLVVVRELTGGLYFGQPKKRWQDDGERQAVDTLSYSEGEIERRLISVDKANVLESSRLWRQIAVELSTEYPDVELDHMLVDACAMRLIQCPADLDVMVTENMFGDILTDEASMLAGSMGMLPSASLAGIPRDRTLGMYEPIHGSAPRRAGMNMANPIAIILSVAMMLRYSFKLGSEAQMVEDSVLAVLEEGYRTYDIMEQGKLRTGTNEMGDLIARRIECFMTRL